MKLDQKLADYIQDLPDDSLDRVANAPAENWKAGKPWRQNGIACLQGHAAGDLNEREMHPCLLDLSVGLHFDRLCRKHGTARIARACILHARETQANRKKISDLLAEVAEEKEKEIELENARV